MTGLHDGLSPTLMREVRARQPFLFKWCVFALALVYVTSYKRVDVRQRALETISLRNEAKMHRIRKRAAIETDSQITKSELLRLQPYEDLNIIKTEQSSQGFLVEKLQETYKNIPVFDGALTVEVSKDGILTGGATGTLIQDIERDLPDVNTRLSKDMALDIAVKAEVDENRRSDIGDEKIELWIYPWEDSKAKLVYYVQYLIETEPAKRPTMIIDAQSGEILERFSALENICSSDSVKGFGGNVKQGKIEYGKYPYCIQPTQKCLLENEYVRVVDMNESENETSTTQETISYQCSTGLNDTDKGAFSPSLDAFFYGTIVAKMYEEWIVLRVHFGKDVDNAMWNGKNVSFGDGDYMFYPLVSLDIVGHEIGHGVVDQNSNLFYMRQSGGINEAFADILGESAVAFFSESNVDWNIGKEVTRQMPFLRTFENPELDGSIAHVDNYTAEQVPHRLSGPFRLAFYNIVAKHNVSFRNAFRAFDRTNKLYWHHMSTYQQAGCDVIKAAYDLGLNVGIFQKSFSAIGVTDCFTLENIPYLTFNRTSSGIKVSEDSHPIFKFKTPLWTANVSVLTTSTEGDVEIRVSDQSDFSCNQSSTIVSNKKLTFEPDGGVDIYIELYAATNNTLNVDLLVSYECNESWKPNMTEYSFDTMLSYCVYHFECGLPMPEGFC
ncbi:hypothetical protein FSP39_015402 [Pinctada imbricata]|uniref:Uncharacterized protein n=1 Tax=Pinctada imbricata TaxID=66713 RepID=A0AA88XS77_PINIB|nr:hypothetical protein FSP39_015402 [Pinctada imbricata]